MNKIKITFVLPQTLQVELKAKLIRDGYSGKRKSIWITEAIQKLLNLNCYPELVKINDVMRGFQKLESFVVSDDLKKQIDVAIIDVRRIYPDLEGVQSRIVRTAIVQRLIQSEAKLSDLTTN